MYFYVWFLLILFYIIISRYWHYVIKMHTGFTHYPGCHVA